MFQTTLKQFDALYKRSAFLDNYKKEAMFSDGMEEFEESREVVQRLVDEYVGRRTPDSAALQLLPTDGGLTPNSSQPMEGTPPHFSQPMDDPTPNSSQPPTCSPRRFRTYVLFFPSLFTSKGTRHARGRTTSTGASTAARPEVSARRSRLQRGNRAQRSRGAAPPAASSTAMRVWSAREEFKALFVGEMFCFEQNFGPRRGGAP